MDKTHLPQTSQTPSQLQTQETRCVDISSSTERRFPSTLDKHHDPDAKRGAKCCRGIHPSLDASSSAQHSGASWKISSTRYLSNPYTRTFWTTWTIWTPSVLQAWPMAQFRIWCSLSLWAWLCIWSVVRSTTWTRLRLWISSSFWTWISSPFWTWTTVAWTTKTWSSWL